jgi:hypothetical protein
MILPDEYTPFVQYPLTIFILLYSLFTVKKFKYFKYKEIKLILLILIFGTISYLIGKTNGYDVNSRAILAPLFFLITVKSKSYKLLIPLFIYCLLVTIIESTMYFMDMSFWSSYSRFGLIRPYGGFLDIHLNGIFLATSLYIFGHKYIGAIIAIISLSLQTPISYSVVFFNKRNIKYGILFMLISGYLLFQVGHLNPDKNDSMIKAYLSIVEYELDANYLLGTSSNIFHINRIVPSSSRHVYIEEIGLVRIVCFFGIPWLIFYVLFVFRISKSKIIPLIYFLTILHQPVGFGIISTCLLAISINYYNMNSSKRIVRLYSPYWNKFK